MRTNKNSSLFNYHNYQIFEMNGLYEIYIYQEATWSLKDNVHLTRKKSKDSHLTEVEIFERQRQRAKYYKNKKIEIQRLIQTNISKNSYFLTLTYKKATTLEDLDKVLQDFKYFITKLNKYYYPNEKRTIKYIGTWEYKKRELDKENSILNSRHLHFHLWIDFPNKKKIKSKDIAELWGHGYINLKKIKVYHTQATFGKSDEEAFLINSKFVGQYISKYISKDLEIKSDLKNRNSILRSKNLEKPKLTQKFIDFSDKSKIPKELFEIKNHKDVFTYERCYHASEKKTKVYKLYLTKNEFEKIKNGGNKNDE